MNKYAYLDACKSIMLNLENITLNERFFYFSSLSSLNESTGSLNRSYNDISEHENGIYVIVR